MQFTKNISLRFFKLLRILQAQKIIHDYGTTIT